MSEVPGTSKSIFGFDPLSIPGCALWLDASDSNTLYEDVAGITRASVSGKVGFWKDKSSNGFNYSMSSTSRPTYSAPGSVRFDTGTYMYNENQWSGWNWDVFCVSSPWAQSNTNDWRTLLRAAGGGHYVIIEYSSERLGYYGTDNFQQFGSLTSIPNTRSLIYVSTNSSRVSSGSINGSTPVVAPGTQYAPGAGQLFYYLGALGGGQAWGTINELLIYPNLTTTQRQQVEGYLSWKWGLENNPQTLTIPGISPSNVITGMPPTIAGCIVWCDASQGSLQNLLPNTAYSAGSTGDLKLNGKNGLTTMTVSRFQRFLVSPGPFIYTYTLFWVGRQTGGQNGRVLNGYYNQLYGYWNGYKKVLHTSSWLIYPAGYYSDTNWDMFSHSRTSSGSYTLKWNGHSLPPGTTSSGNPMYGLTINYGDANDASGGGGENSDCEVAEIILYNQVLPSFQIQQIENYLATKWGFTTSAVSTTNTSLALWLDAKDPSGNGVVPANGATITTWVDKSGNGRNGTATGGSPIYTTNSINGFPSIYFSNAPYFAGSVSITGGTFTAFAVGITTEPNNLGRSPRLLSLIPSGTSDYATAGGSMAICQSGNPQMNTYRNGVGSYVLIPALGTAFLATAEYDGTNQYLWINGGTPASASSTGTFAVTNYGVGGAAYGGSNWLGYIGEVLLFNNAMDAAERREVESYLATKWGITIPSVSTLTYSPGLWLDAADRTTMSFGAIPTSYFPFNNSLKDQSNVITLTAYGSVPYVTGRYGTALSFSNASGTLSSNYVSTSYNLPSTFSVSFWFQTPSAVSNALIFGTAPSSAYSYGEIGVYLNSGYLFATYFHIQNSGVVATISANTWYHVVMTYNNGTLLTYVNGTVGGSPVTAGGSSINGFTIGGGADVGGASDAYPFTGLVDEFCTYTSVLTSTQISNMYSQKVVKWNDKSGNGNYFTPTAGTVSLTTDMGNPVVNFPEGAILSSTNQISLTPAAAFYTVFRITALSGQGLDYVIGITNTADGVQTGDCGYRFGSGGLAGSGSNSGGAQDLGNSNYYVNGTFNPSFPLSTYSNAFVMVGNTVSSMTTTTYLTISTAFSSRAFVGNMAELLYYPTGLSATQRQEVEAYLSTKWGIPTSGGYTPLLSGPANVPGCTLWLDASDKSTLTFSSGNKVVGWRDKVNGLVASNTSSSGNQPTYVPGDQAGLGTLYFDAPVGLQYLDIPPFSWGTTTRSCFFVMKNVASVVNNGGAYGGYPHWFWDLVNGNDNNVWTLIGWTNIRAGGANQIYEFPLNEYVIYELVYSNSTITQYKTGVQTQNYSTYSSFYDATNGFRLGALPANRDETAYRFYGNFAEIILFNTAVNTTQRKSIERYLCQKWGLKSTYNTIPGSIGGLELWLDAADSSTVTGTTTMTAWKDKSQNAYTANSFSNSVGAPSWVSNAPIVGPAVQYSAGNGSSIANFVLAQTMSIFEVYYPINQSTDSPFLEHGPDENANSGFYFHAQNGQNFAINSGTGQVSVNYGNVAVSNTWQLISGINPDPEKSSTMSFYSNGQVKAWGSTQLGTTNVTRTLFINGRNGANSLSYNAYLAELIIFSKALNADERKTIESYLAKKWNIVVPTQALPLTHPFTAIKPFARQFNPVDIPGCTMWLDASDATSVCTGFVENFSNSSVSSYTYYGSSGNWTWTNGGISYSSSPFAINPLNKVPGSLGYSSFIQVFGSTPSTATRATTDPAGVLCTLRFLYCSRDTNHPPASITAKYGSATIVTINSPISASIWTRSVTRFVSTAANQNLIFAVALSGDGYNDQTGNIAYVTLTYSATGSSPVIQIADKSGKENSMTAFLNFSNATVSSAYQNGLNVLNFSGDGIYRTFPNSMVYPLDCYVVVAVKDLTTAVDVIGMGSTSSDFFNSLTFSEYTSRRWHNGSTSFNRTPNAVSPSDETSTSFLLINWSIADSNYIIRRNGVQLVQTSSYTFSDPPVGALFQLGLRYPHFGGSSPGNTFRGYIGELIVYNSQLSSDQRQRVEGYLAKKWGLAGNLQSTHPFYKVPPTTAIPFSPRNISDCTIWLDASQDTTPTGTYVTTLIDHSGSNNNFTPYTANTITVTPNGLNNNSIYHFGYNSVTNPSIYWSASFTQFVVLKGNSQYITCTLTGTGSYYGTYVYAGNWNLIAINQNAASAVDGELPYNNPIFTRSVTGTTGWNIFCIGYTAGSSYLTNYSLNGTVRLATVSGTAFRVDYPSSYKFPMYINGNPYGNDNSDIAEFIHFNRDLTREQRQQVEGYLAQKWGLTANLPSSHPYRFFPLVQTPSSPVYTPGLYVRFYNSDGTPDPNPNGYNWGVQIGTPGPYQYISFGDMYWTDRVYRFPQEDNIVLYAKGYFYSPIDDTMQVSTLSDDGIKVVLGGEPIINNWTYHGGTTDTSATYSVSAGYTPFYLMMFEGGGGAVCEMSWKVSTTSFSTNLAGRFFYDASDP